MRLRRIDMFVAVAFAVISAGGLWLWTGTGPLVWLNNFALMCGFG